MSGAWLAERGDTWLDTSAAHPHDLGHGCVLAGTRARVARAGEPTACHTTAPRRPKLRRPRGPRRPRGGARGRDRAHPDRDAAPATRIAARLRTDSRHTIADDPHRR